MTMTTRGTGPEQQSGAYSRRMSAPPAAEPQPEPTTIAIDLALSLLRRIAKDPWDPRPASAAVSASSPRLPSGRRRLGVKAAYDAGHSE